VILSKGYGWADAGRRIPNRPDTRFRIASITKTFTAVVVLQLVEEGKFTLSSTVAELLPYYRQDTGRRITIRHLLSHTCGLPNYLAREGFVEEASKERLSTKAFVEKYCMGNLEFDPGTRQRYTNTGFFVLGAIVEAVTGRPFQNVLRERVLDPAGLHQTAWGNAPLPGAGIAMGYDRIDGVLRPSPDMDPVLLGAAGALTSTTGDLFRWDRALASGELLSVEMKRRMFMPVMGNYALGWTVKTLPVGPDEAPRIVIGHDGGISGHLTRFWRIPKDGICIVLFSNAWDNDYRAISEGVLDILYGREPAAPKEGADP